jgi:hypothetical protein
MTSDGDELEKALRENLKLRRELAANVAKEEAARQRGGMAYRLGWIIYWTCFTVALCWVLAVFLSADVNLFRLPVALAWVGPAVVLYGLGRGFRYVLSGK